jgi:hypothetical protein
MNDGQAPVVRILQSCCRRFEQVVIPYKHRIAILGVWVRNSFRYIIPLSTDVLLKRLSNIIGVAEVEGSRQI